jgi:hypothetical protein
MQQHLMQQQHEHTAHATRAAYAPYDQNQQHSTVLVAVPWYAVRSVHYYCLLPTAYCLLPTAYCLLPTAYCLQGQQPRALWSLHFTLTNHAVPVRVRHTRRVVPVGTTTCRYYYL